MTGLAGKLDSEELMIVEVKYKSARFGTMRMEDQLDWTAALMLKIHTITGWIIPSGGMLTIMVDQLKKKFLESYPMCNPDEIEYAFRKYGTNVKDWGKEMNLSLVDFVMGKYMDARMDVSNHEEQIEIRKASGSIEDEKEKNLSEEARADWLEHVKRQVKEGVVLDFMPLELYNWLSTKGKLNLSNKKKDEYIRNAFLYRKRFLIQECQDNQNNSILKTHLDDLLMMEKQGYLTGLEIQIVKNIAKKMVLYDYIRSEYVHPSLSETETRL